MNRAELMFKRKQILEVAAKRGARRIRLFGSAARGDSGPASDVDFLVDFEPGRSLLDQGGLLKDLQDLLGARSTWSAKGDFELGTVNGSFGRLCRYEKGC